MHSEDEESAEEEQINETVFILDVKLFEEFEREFLKKCNIVTYYED